MVSIYIDDLIYTGNNEDLCAIFKQSMMKEFEMTDLGKMRFYLGVEVNQNANEIHLCQKKHAREVLKRFNMCNCNSVKNLIVHGIVLSREGGELLIQLSTSNW